MVATAITLMVIRFRVRLNGGLSDNIGLMKIFILAIVLVAAWSNATADVGFLLINKLNQSQQSANRIRVSIANHPANTVTILITPRSGERFTKAELEVWEVSRLVARVPVQAVPQRDSTAQTIELTLSPPFAQRSRLNVLIDSTDARVGTVFGIELGTYF